VFLDPFERGDRIEGSKITRLVFGCCVCARDRVMGKPTEYTKAIMNRDDNDILADREAARVIEQGAADGIPTSVNPEHDGKSVTSGRSVLGCGGWRENIQR